ncbi:MAG: HU family DNA-binding protein [Minicystis sp.]
MAGSNKLTKAQIIAALAEGSGLDKKAVNGLLDALASLIKKELGPNGPGEITVPNLVKLKAKATPATEDRQGVNPFTKQPQLIKGKPASLKVRATPVKALKDMLAPGDAKA